MQRFEDEMKPRSQNERAIKMDNINDHERAIFFI